MTLLQTSIWIIIITAVLIGLYLVVSFRTEYTDACETQAMISQMESDLHEVKMFSKNIQSLVTQIIVTNQIN